MKIEKLISDLQAIAAVHPNVRIMLEHNIKYTVTNLENITIETTNGEIVIVLS
jgi:hypothetical protein